MKKPFRIGIGHKRRVGKDTFAAMLAREFIKQDIWHHGERSVHTTGFATPLYQVAEKLFKPGGMKSKEFYEMNGPPKEEVLPHYVKSPRDILIDVGMKMREIHADVWLEYALHLHFGIIIFTDMRFPNEADAMDFTVRVNRDSAPKAADPDDPDNQLEGYLMHYEIDNNGGLKGLRNQAAKLCAFINKEYSGGTIEMRS